MDLKLLFRHTLRQIWLILSLGGLCHLFFIPVGAQEPAKPAAEKNLYEWLFETFQFPALDLVHGFASEQRGALQAPPMPPADAPEAAVIDFMKRSDSVTRHYLELKGATLPKGVLAIFDPATKTLSVRAPRVAMTSVYFLADALHDAANKVLMTDPVLFEAKPELLRGICERAGQKADHSLLLQEMEAAVTRGEAKVISRNRLSTSSGNRAKVSQTLDFVSPSNLTLHRDGLIGHETERRSEGTVWEIDPVLGADNETVDLNFSLTHHYLPNERRQAFITVQGETSFNAAVTDFHEAQVVSQITTMNKYAKLVGVWKPESRGDDVLQAAFIKSDIVAILPVPNRGLEKMLRDHGAKILPVPEGKPEFTKVAEEIPDGMIVRRYVIPPTFISGGPGTSNQKGPMDPFAADDNIRNEPRMVRRVTAMDVLKMAGIQFPKGSSANFIPPQTLVVRNVPDQIELVDAYLESIKGGVEKTIAITVHLIQAPEAMIHDAIEKSRAWADHAEVFEALQKSPEFRFLNTSWIEGRSGNRSKVTAGKTYHYNLPVIGPAKDEEKKTPPAPAATQSSEYLSAATESEFIGISVEVDPILGADNYTIDLNYAVGYDFAPPLVSGKAEMAGAEKKLDAPVITFHKSNLNAQTTLGSGMTRLIGVWRPRGKPEFPETGLLQAAFIKAEIVKLIEETAEAE